MEFKGTGGEWHYKGGYVYSDSENVAEVFGFTKDEKKANGTLIKAAPEMLELIIYLNSKGGLGLDVHKRFKEIIKKATEF